MKAIVEFTQMDMSFWAHVKLISEQLGYSERGKRKSETRSLKKYTKEEIISCLRNCGLNLRDTIEEKILRYLNARANLLEINVAPSLMTREEAATLFKKIRRDLKPKCSLPLNKQKKEKRHYNYLSCIVNMLTEASLRKMKFVDEPRNFITVTKEGKLLRTLSRWMDGAYPSTTDPHAIWEIKEYYGTTTFGSRVADGVYETMLDGFELRELFEKEGRKIFHYLIVDDKFTWWDCGRSYLCRIVDMMHIGLVDEVLFGKEVLERWPQIVKSWT